MHFHRQHQALEGIACGRSLIDSLLDPNMSTIDTNTNFSFIMGDANLNQAGDMRTCHQAVRSKETHFFLCGMLVISSLLRLC